MGGRWNRWGTAVVYTSESLALAALEYLVHVDPGELPDDLVTVSADIPDSVSIERVKPRPLPADWRAYPAPVAVTELGTKWVRQEKTAVLAVPSVVIPTEWNYLLNPAHTTFEQIRIGALARFSLDHRLVDRPRRR